MPTQGIAETECTLSLQSLEHVASNIHSDLVHFNGLDIVVLGHLWADWGTQAGYSNIFKLLFVITHTHTHTYTRARARPPSG